MLLVLSGSAGRGDQQLVMAVRASASAPSSFRKRARRSEAGYSVQSFSKCSWFSPEMPGAAISSWIRWPELQQVLLVLSGSGRGDQKPATASRASVSAPGSLRKCRARRSAAGYGGQSFSSCSWFPEAPGAAIGSPGYTGHRQRMLQLVLLVLRKRPGTAIGNRLRWPAAAHASVYNFIFWSDSFWTLY